MICSRTNSYFISINRKGSTFPNFNFVKTYVNEGESFNQSAKFLRKFVIEHNLKEMKLKPSDFSWAVYSLEKARNHEYFFDGTEYYELICASEEDLYSDCIVIEEK